jgi:hypothetical protein
MTVQALIAQAQFCNMPIDDHFEQAKSELAQDLHIVPYRVMGDGHASPTRFSSSTSAQQHHTNKLKPVTFLVK